MDYFVLFYCVGSGFMRVLVFFCVKYLSGLFVLGRILFVDKRRFFVIGLWGFGSVISRILCVYGIVFM